MATGLKKDAAHLDENDPFRLGWRYVNETGPDGVVVSRQVPLTEDDVLYPQEDDFIVQNDAHTDDIYYLKGCFQSALKDRPTMRVFCDHRIDFGVKGIRPFGPDIVVFEGVTDWDRNRGTFPAAELGATPLLAVAVTSPTTRKNDVGIKVELYERCVVPMYVLVDRLVREESTEVPLRAYKLGPAGYELIDVDEQGRLWLDAVGLYLTISDDRAVCFDTSGRRILSFAEEITARRESDERVAEMEATVRALQEELRRRNGT